MTETAAAGTIVEIAERIALGLGRGGRLLVDGHGRGIADSRHVVVEFMHPVTVGKRALPAFEGIAGRRPDDVTMTIAYGGHAPTADVDIAFTDRPGARDGTIVFELPDDVGAAKVAAVLGYHVTWELVHLFLESPSRIDTHAPAASSLYPMLYETVGDRTGLDHLRVAATRSAEAKFDESAAVCELALSSHVDELDRAATLMASAGNVYTVGNGGSSTDATDAAMAFGPTARSLTDDVATISALANDVSFDVVFARQLATVGRPGDCLLAFSTSGNSPNVIEAAGSARRVGMSTVGLTGYDGGAMAASDVFDVVIVVASDSVHRIQEAHSTIVARLARSATH